MCLYLTAKSSKVRSTRNEKETSVLHDAHLRQTSFTVTMRKSDRLKKETVTRGKGSRGKGSQPKVKREDSQTKEEESEDGPEDVFPKIDFTIKLPLL